jgi:hypothetical protein
VERGGSTLHLEVIESVGVVFVTVVGPQVEVYDNLHLLGQQFDDIPPNKRVRDSFEPFWLELRP